MLPLRYHSTPMPIKPREDIAPPDTNLRDLEDRQRYIAGGPAWPLADVQDFLRQLCTNGIRILTQQAITDLEHDLRWNVSELCGFICALHPCRYLRSEWVYASGKSTVPFIADVYVMGFHRIRQEEWQEQKPWNYVKFSVSKDGSAILIFSIHPEHKK